MASRCVIALGVVAAICAIGGVARADDDGLKLDWSAPVGCPTREAIHDATTRLVSKGAPGALEARGVISKRARGTFHVEIEIGTGDEKSTRSFEGDSCAAVSDAAVLMLAIAIDPEAGASAPKDGNGNGNADTPTHASVEPTPAAEPAVVPPSAKAVRESRVVIAVGGVIDTGATGGVAPGIWFGAGVMRGRMGIELEGGVLPARRATIDGRPDEGASASSMRGGVRACYMFLGAPEHAHMGGCLGADADWVHASGFGARVVDDAEAVFITTSAAVRIEVPMTMMIGLRFGIEGAIPLARPSFVIDEAGTVSRTPFAIARVMVGPEVRF